MSLETARMNETWRGGAVLLWQKSGTVGYLDLGNVTLQEFGFDPEVEEVEHFRTGKKEVAFRDITKLEQPVGFTFNTLTPALLALALFGDTPAAYAQTSGALSAAAVTCGALDKWVSVGKYKLAATVTVKDATDTTTYVENEDYELDRDFGLIRPLTGGDIAADAVLHITADYSGITTSEIKIQTQSAFVEGAAQIAITLGATPLRAKTKWLRVIPKCRFERDGAFQIGGTNLAEAKFKLVPLSDSTQSAGYEYGYLRPLQA